jgi:hypothetical protein
VKSCDIAPAPSLMQELLMRPLDQGLDEPSTNSSGERRNKYDTDVQPFEMSHEEAML